MTEGGYMYDYHLHSNFSEDSSAEMEDLVKSAIAQGFKEIAMTDHVDFDYPDRSFTFELDVNAYFSEIERLNHKYGHEIQILKGIEIGLQPQVLEESADLVKNYDFDFVLGSFHTGDCKDLYTGTFFEEKNPVEAYRGFYTYVLKCLEAYDHYNILGHINVIDRYIDFLNNEKPAFSAYEDLIEKILIHLIKNEKGLEINSSSSRYGMDDTLPSLEILNRYKELGGTLVTFGSDSHGGKHVGYEYEKAVKLMKSVGFTHWVTFRKMKPISVPLAAK